jgi:hypothetical protein
VKWWYAEIHFHIHRQFALVQSDPFRSGVLSEHSGRYSLAPLAFADERRQNKPPASQSSCPHRVPAFSRSVPLVFPGIFRDPNRQREI